MKSESGPSRPAVIDVHSHPSFQPYHELARAMEGLGPAERFPDRTFFPPGMPVWTPEGALEVQDQQKIAAQALSLPDVTLGLRGETARRWARRINEALAEVVAAHPSRFAAFGVIPHDDVDSSLAEITYALDVLKLDGIATSTNVRGAYLGDPMFDPWMEELHRREAVLFVHPTLPARPEPATPPLIEFCFDTARMVMKMAMSGAKRRFSGMKVISTHGGGAIPAICHRFETYQPLVDRSCPPTEEIAEDIRSFYYDLTSCMGAPSLGGLAHFVDPSKILMGFDLPYAPSFTVTPEVDRFLAFDGLDAAAKAKIVSANALELFPRLAAAHGGGGDAGEAT